MADVMALQDMAVNVQETLRGVRRKLHWLIVGTFALYLIGLTSMTWFALDASHRRADIATVAVQTNSALCALRTDLKRRVADGAAFLAKHPRGVFGLSAASIEASLDGQRRTVAALDRLRCPPDMNLGK